MFCVHVDLLFCIINVFLFWCLYCCCHCCCYSSLFWSEGAQCHDIIMDKSKMYFYIVHYYWLLWKCSCFVKRYFLHIQYKCIETFIIECLQMWKLLLFENSSRLIYYFSLNHYCILNILLKIFCHLLFHLNGVRSLHLRGYILL